MGAATRTTPHCSLTTPSPWRVDCAGKSGSPDYSLYGLYSVAPTVSVGTAVTLPTGGSIAATVGGVYKCNPKTTIKSKVTTDLIGAVTVVHVRSTCAATNVTLIGHVCVWVGGAFVYRGDATSYLFVHGCVCLCDRTCCPRCS